jgi:hypothetical protein
MGEPEYEILAVGKALIAMSVVAVTIPHPPDAGIE